MPIVYQAEDTIEPWHDTDAEMLANAALYNVQDGCAVTYSGANMNATIASGNVTHNGSTVAVAGGSVTLVADGSNPRWTWIYVDSTGTGGMSAGTAAADPSKPELGDNVALALVKVEAGQTIANNIAYKLDKRIMAQSSTDSTTVRKASNESVTSSTTLQNDDELKYAMAANTNYHFEISVLYTGATAGDIKFSINLPSGADLWASGIIPSGGTVSMFGPITSPLGVISGLDALGTTNPTMIFIRGVVMNGSTAGDLQFQWAQNASSGTATTVYAGSYLKVWS